MKIIVVSSRATLFLRLLLPSLWVSANLAFLFFPWYQGLPWSLLMLPLLSLIGFLGLWFLAFRNLRWLGLNTESLYVSNYFKSVKYTFNSVQSIAEEQWGPFRRIRLRLHQPGSLGQELVFFASYNWYYFLQNHPDILRKLLNEEGH